MKQQQGRRATWMQTGADAPVLAWRKARTSLPPHVSTGGARAPGSPQSMRSSRMHPGQQGPATNPERRIHPAAVLSKPIRRFASCHTVVAVVRGAHWILCLHCTGTMPHPFQHLLAMHRKPVAGCTALPLLVLGRRGLSGARPGPGNQTTELKGQLGCVLDNCLGTQETPPGMTGKCAA